VLSLRFSFHLAIIYNQQVINAYGRSRIRIAGSGWNFLGLSRISRNLNVWIAGLVAGRLGKKPQKSQGMCSLIIIWRHLAAASRPLRSFIYIESISEHLEAFVAENGEKAWQPRCSLCSDFLSSLLRANLARFVRSFVNLNKSSIFTNYTRYSAPSGFSGCFSVSVQVTVSGWRSFLLGIGA